MPGSSLKERKFHISIRTSLFLFLFIGCQNNASKELYTGPMDLPDNIDFNYHVRPILSDRCYKCHGPDEKVRQANLRFDTKEGAFSLLDSVEKKYAIVPGEPDKSLIVHRVSSSDSDYKMPPPESKLSLSNKEIETIKRWIEQGAKWKKHWAFIPPEKTELPNISKKDWPHNEIDYFVLNRLEKEGLQPTVQAAKEKLIRRLSFDIRGVPPTLQEIDLFMKDNSSQAYEDLVDNFISQSSYGERMTLEWLDIARYADSHGYQDDLERSMWPWRDWVIKAFNENMPYDQFLTWQLAGDLFHNASYDQKLATGFNRNHKITQEVGVVDEEYRVEYVLDRVNTFSTALLGLTVACAQCHDHKFDQISQKEFYSLYSFFNNVSDKGRVEYGVSVAEPSIPIPEPKAKKYRDRLKKLIVSQEKLISQYEKEAWAKNSNLEIQNLSYKENVNTLSGIKAYYPLDHISNETVHEIFGEIRPGEVINGVVPRPGYFSGALEFNGENYLDLGVIPGIDFHGPLSISFWVYNIDDGANGVVIAPNLDDENLNAGFEISINHIKQVNFVMTSMKEDKEQLRISTKNRLAPNKWSHVVTTYNGTTKPEAIRIYIDGKPTEIDETIWWDRIKDELTDIITKPKSIRVGAKASIDHKKRSNGLVRARLDEIMFFDRKLNEEEVKYLYSYNPLKELNLKNKNLSGHETVRLFYHQLHQKDTFYQSLTKRLSEYKIREERLENVGLKPTMVMADIDTVRPTFVLERGQYNAPTEKVYPGTPKSVLSFPEEYEKNRMGLSKWLFDPRNPLTARVAVNRYWQMIFGKGIVTTPEDFGSQGNLPSHPQLLDWLAIEFLSSNWNVKELIKIMVMSSTYRQSVKSDPILTDRDPDNLLLSRGPQNRLQAEFIRDYALSISGLLNKEVGGPSVKPYQPKGLWLEMATGNQPLKKYIQEHDGDLYRKSMYTFWKRSVPPPSMITFDASTREQCTVRRQSTSSPMQALTLLNDPQFIEASRLIAQRIISEGGENPKERIIYAFRLATSRFPEKKEMNLLIDLLDEQEDIFSGNPEKAQGFLGIGEYPIDSKFNITELASYTVIASTILNLTEATRKG